MKDFSKSETDLINFAIKLKNQKEYKQSNAILTEMLAKYNDSPILCGLIAGNYYKIGDYEDSTYYFDKVVKLSPNSELASLGLYHSLLELEYNDLAFEEMDRFLSKNKPKLYKVTLEELYEGIEEGENFTEEQIQIILKYCNLYSIG